MYYAELHTCPPNPLHTTPYTRKTRQGTLFIRAGPISITQVATFHHLCSHFHITYSLHCADPPKSYTHTSSPSGHSSFGWCTICVPTTHLFLTTVDFHGCAAFQFNIWTCSA